MNNGLIIYKKAGQTVDERLLVKALEQFPSAIGTVTRAGEDLHVSNDRGVPDLETMQEALKAAHDHDVYIWLANISEQDSIKQEDIQPFVIQDDGKNIIAVMTEGDFPRYSDAKSGSDEWANFSTQILVPTLNEYAELSGGDFSKFVEHIHGKMFEKNIMSHVGHRGIVAVIPCVGDALVLSQNNSLLGTYDWGFTTQHLNHDVIENQEPVKEPEPEIVPEKKGFFSFGSKTKSETATPAPQETPQSDPVKEPEKKEEPKVVPNAHKNMKNSKGSIPAPAVGVTVPDSLQGKARKQYIRKAMGLTGSSDTLPEGWWSKGFVIPDPKTAVLKTPVKDLKDLKTAMQTSSSSSAIEAGKKAGEFPVKESASSPLPVIPEKNKLGVMDLVAKRLDKNSQEITDPKKMQASESKFPTFTEATGVKISDIKKLAFVDLRDFATTYPVEAAILIMELRGMVPAEEKVEEKPADAPVQQPVQEPKKAASGGGLFGFRR